jgi:hypothetical protein
VKDEVACERTYQVLTEAGVRPLPVRWLQPMANPRGDWGCVFQIDWPDPPHRTMTIFGVDSVQALYLALQTVAVELYTADRPVFLWEPDDLLHLPTTGVIADLEAARTKGRS